MSGKNTGHYYMLILYVLFILVVAGFLARDITKGQQKSIVLLPDYECEAKLILEGECGAITPLQRTRFKTYEFKNNDGKREYTVNVVTTERGNKYFFYFIEKEANKGGHYFIHTAHAAKDGIPPFNIPRKAWEHALDEEGNASYLLMLDPRPQWSRLSDCKTWRP